MASLNLPLRIQKITRGQNLNCSEKENLLNRLKRGRVLQQ
ncbi:hypothetical protein MC7420_4343 [Coleofasciculus chthonoplastes PCC 7420]|uniref:Uncharacterized protein n=1 Tax=Coleofasciculus chthonoplastes PCC 7420 TaxID=118168 RepID=B4VXU9_9CYAN|nr:hypothetical protein MC7420_4343 [Coleofasciculus chthonoplastes PCC 7420]